MKLADYAAHDALGLAELVKRKRLSPLKEGVHALVQFDYGLAGMFAERPRSRRPS